MKLKLIDDNDLTGFSSKKASSLLLGRLMSGNENFLESLLKPIDVIVD